MKCKTSTFEDQSVLLIVYNRINIHRPTRMVASVSKAGIKCLKTPLSTPECFQSFYGLASYKYVYTYIVSALRNSWKNLFRKVKNCTTEI